MWIIRTMVMAMTDQQVAVLAGTVVLALLLMVVLADTEAMEMEVAAAASVSQVLMVNRATALHHRIINQTGKHNRKTTVQPTRRP